MNKKLTYILLTMVALTIMVGISFAKKENNHRTKDINFGGNANMIWSIFSNKTFSYMQVVDDLDGDSLKDILTTEYKYNEATNKYYYKLTARKGYSGKKLWSTSIAGIDVSINGYSMGDVNGDGLNDIMVKTFDNISNIKTIQIRKGFNGKILWEQNVYGLLSGKPIKDLDGDGLNDMLVTTYNLNTYPINTTILQAKKGIDGSVIWQESKSSPAWIPPDIDAISANDINSDKINDLFLIIYDHNNGFYTVKGKTGLGKDLWSFDSLHEDNEYVYGIPVDDLNGDNIYDLLLHYNDGLFNVKVMNGINGYVLWEISNYKYGMSAGDLDGDELNDILINEDESYYDPRQDTFKAKKGIDGTDLWQENINGYFYGVPILDINGDGLNDILLHEYNNSGMVTIKVKKGIDGSIIWKKTSRNQYSYEIGDVDGDNLNDIALNIQNDSTSIQSLKIKKGFNAKNLWQKSIKNGSIKALQAGDLDKDGFNDLILIINKDKYVISANKGNNGKNIWKAESKSEIKLGYYENSIKNDLNGDGKNDILMGTNNEIYLVTN